MESLKSFILFYIFIFLIVPASSLILLKIFIISLLVFIFLILLLTNKIKLNIISLMYILLLIFFLFLSFFQISDLESGFSFFSRTLVLILQIFILYTFVKNKIIALKEIINIIFLSGIAYLLIKTFLIILIFQGKLELISNFIKNIVFTDYIFFIRLNLGNDAIILFSLLFILPFLAENNFRFILTQIVILFILISSFTKYILITYLLALAILALRRYAIWVKLIPLLIFIGFLFLYFFQDIIQYIYTIYKLRFEEVSSYSDKLFQIKLFIKEISNNLSNFLIGKGGGEYIKWFIKDENLKFSYEVQWLSLVYQIGIIRIIFILYFIIYLLFMLFKRSIYFGIIFLLWVFASFTNPYLLIQSSFIIYTLAFLIIYNIKEEKFENSYTWYKRHS
jgi:hypothetical protein